MRILNRPMFRYGGPIKEGVMHGMRDGGRAALVGNPIFPKTAGREHRAQWKVVGDPRFKLRSQKENNGISIEDC